MSFDEGFIPRHVLRDYARDEGLEFASLFWRVRALDKAYLAWRRERREQEKKLEARRADQVRRVRRST